LTILYALILRFRAVPGEVEEHDRLARQRDEDLAQWVADDHLRLGRELRKIVGEHSSRGHLHSGVLGRSLAHAKERALHAHRDQERAAQRFIDELAAKETWLHRDHRRQRGREPLRLTAPARAQPALDCWRDSSWAHPPGVASAEVEDPTRRTLEATIAQLELEATDDPR
jgi:hypothetical protein